MSTAKRKDKPRRGRPPLPPGEALEAVVPLRCRKVELAAFKAAAAREGVSLTSWVRARLRRAAGLPGH